MTKKAFIIDGNSYAYKVFFAIKNLSNSKGQPINAVFGFARMLLKILKEKKPDYIAVAFDLPHPTFRHKKYEEYKIQRTPMPDDLVFQMELIKKSVLSFNIPLYELAGFEADDIIGTLANKLEQQGFNVFILTGDKDMLQLVNSKINVLSAHKEDFVYSENKIKEKYNVLPSQIVDLIALMGDASDNIPGVNGIGPKTASDLIEQFGTVENILSNADKIESEKLRDKILSSVENIKMSRELATIQTDVPIKISFEATPIDKNKLFEFLKEMEFKSLYEEAKDMYGSLPSKIECEIVKSTEEFNKLKDELQTAKKIALGVNISKENILELIITPYEKKAYSIQFDTTNSLAEKEVFNELKPVFENQNIEKYLNDSKKITLFLIEKGIKLKGIKFDLSLACYLLNRQIPEIDTADIIGTMLEDAKECKEKLKEQGLEKLFWEVEMPLSFVLAKMEIRGIAVDLKFLTEYSVFLKNNLDSLQKEIFLIAQEEFNINSPQQLSKILFEKLNLPKSRKIKTGYSTDVEVLESLAVHHELPAKILEYRGVYKLKTGFVDALCQIANPATGRVHTSFNQTGTSTGRLSSSNPNLQNIPIKTDLGKQIRKAFIPDKKDYLIISADYSQIELRILAHLSKDPMLSEAFKKGEDIHLNTAKEIFGVKDNEVTPILRRRAKAINFGIVYGISAFGLSKELNLNVREAQEYINKYFEKYKKVKEYMDETIETAREQGFVSTILGRRRYFPEIKNSNKNIREFSERAAINSPIQGSASDLIKAAMIEIDNEIEKHKLNTNLLLQVHDELVLEVHEKEAKKVKDMVKDRMENIISLNVPIIVDIKSGKNWYEAH